MEESLILLKEKFHLKETDANQYSRHLPEDMSSQA